MLISSGFSSLGYWIPSIVLSLLHLHSFFYLWTQTSRLRSHHSRPGLIPFHVSCTLLMSCTIYSSYFRFKASLLSRRTSITILDRSCNSSFYPALPHIPLLSFLQFCLRACRHILYRHLYFRYPNTWTIIATRSTRSWRASSTSPSTARVFI